MQSRQGYMCEGGCSLPPPTQLGWSWSPFPGGLFCAPPLCGSNRAPIGDTNYAICCDLLRFILFVFLFLLFKSIPKWLSKASGYIPMLYGTILELPKFRPNLDPPILYSSTGTVPNHFQQIVFYISQHDGFPFF